MNSLPSKILTDVVEQLAFATKLEDVTRIIASAARKLSGADGTTFVLRDGTFCYYVDEDAISTLWKGHRFPMASCISGWAMEHKKVVVIRDICQDSRIPHDAYRPTFVKSLCMVPVRAADPIAAIGNYWKQEFTPSEDDIKHLQILANSAAIALENLQLKESLNRVQGGAPLSAEALEKQFEVAIHTLAHDLRNPLSTIVLFGELAREKLRGFPDEKLQMFIESIISTGNLANEQIRKMLALYSVKDGSLEKKSVNLSDMVFNISEQLRARAPSRKVNFEIEPNLNAIADPHLIELALENLVSNAYKYTCKKPEATIEFKKQRASENIMTFFVRDDGEGFDEADTHKLFQPLVRLHDAREFPGTGLGLVSVAKIIRMHGGSIRAEGARSRGATFYVDLPS